MERNRIPHEGFFLLWGRIEIQLFAIWILIVEVDITGVYISLLLRKGTEERSVIQEGEQRLGNLYFRPFHTCIRPGKVADFVYFGVLLYVKKGRAEHQNVFIVLRINIRDRKSYVPD